MPDSLGDRMKLYEDAYRIHLPPRMPIIIRVDGKAFHTLTRKCQKPFDASLAGVMDATAQALLEEVQDARMAYVQSDEISLLLINYNKFASQPWFDCNLQKMVSIAASVAGANFTATSLRLSSQTWGGVAYFDGRAFILPEAEVCNYFLWRQLDATRNSIQMVAQSMFSHKQLLGKNCNELQDMVFEKGTNWNDYEPYWKRGRVISREGVDRNIPIFTEDRQYIEKFMVIEEK